MALPFKKPDESVPAKSARARITELEAERREITTRIVAMESEGARPGAHTESISVHAAAVALVAGKNEPPATVISSDGTELQRLYDKRVIIDRALELLHQQDLIEEAARVRELMERERPEWMSILRKRALQAIALQQTNQQFETYKRRYAALGTLPGARFKLLGTGAEPGNEVLSCAEELVRAGILTQKEIE
jgi:hypothetical protein